MDQFNFGSVQLWTQEKLDTRKSLPKKPKPVLDSANTGTFRTSFMHGRVTLKIPKTWTAKEAAVYFCNKGIPSRLKIDQTFHRFAFFMYKTKEEVQRSQHATGASIRVCVCLNVLRSHVARWCAIMTSPGQGAWVRSRRAFWGQPFWHALLVGCVLCDQMCSRAVRADDVASRKRNLQPDKHKNRIRDGSVM